MKVLNSLPAIQLQHQNYALLFRVGLTLIIAMIVMLIPELTYASACEGAGCFAGDSEVIDNSSKSLAYYWSVGRVWLMWGGLIYIPVAIFVLKSASWWIGLVIWAIAVFGERTMRFFAGLGGINL